VKSKVTRSTHELCATLTAVSSCDAPVIGLVTAAPGTGGGGGHRFDVVVGVAVDGVVVAPVEDVGARVDVERSVRVVDRDDVDEPAFFPLLEQAAARSIEQNNMARARRTACILAPGPHAHVVIGTIRHTNACQLTCAAKA
jgi:hypothetical protein